jgi:hypothetical protein
MKAHLLKEQTDDGRSVLRQVTDCDKIIIAVVCGVIEEESNGTL